MGSLLTSLCFDGHQTCPSYKDYLDSVVILIAMLKLERVVSQVLNFFSTPPTIFLIETLMSHILEGLVMTGSLVDLHEKAIEIVSEV